MSRLTDNVTRFFSRHGMPRPGSIVLAAVSGGPDSMAMLHALVELSGALGIKLAVAHMDHGLRPDSSKDARFVAEAADALGLKYIVAEARLGDVLKGVSANVQDAAREARYTFLMNAAEELGADKIAAGHTMDDQAETYLMRELRGSGPHGLAGIPPVRGSIIRPLIETTRAEVMEYIAERGISYVTDPTNLKPKYTRNKIRLELLPAMMEHNPNIIRTLARSAGVMRDEDGFMDAYAGSLLPGLITSDQGFAVRMDGSAWAGLHIAIRRRILRLVAGRLKGDTRGIGFGHVEDALGMLDAGLTGKGVDLPGGVRVESSYGNPVVYRPDGVPGGFEHALDVPGKLEVPETGIVVEASVAGPCENLPGGDGDTAVFDMEKLGGPLVVRNRRPGDRFQPSGMAGSVKLKEFFIDMKITRVDRALTPILTAGGEIAWVMGHRQDRRSMPGPDTTRLLVVRIARKDPAG